MQIDTRPKLIAPRRPRRLRMTRRILAALLCLALPALAAAAQRAPRRRAAAPASPADLTAPFAQLLPADTFVYLEVDHLASAAEEIGGVETLYVLIDRTFSNNGERFPLTLSDFRMVLESSVAIGVTVPKFSIGSSSVDPVVVGLIRTPSEDVAAVISKAITAQQQRTLTKRPPTSKTVRGVRVTTIPATNPKNAFSYGLVGSTFVFGTPSAVVDVLNVSATHADKRLADVPGFVSAANRAPAGRQVFAFLNGGPMVRAVNASIDSSFSGGTAARRAEQRAAAEALKSFVGIDAIAGGSLSGLVSGNAVSIQGSIELDRSRGGIVSLLSDAPPITMRSVSLLPADTDFVSASSVDAIAIYDLALRVITPPVAKAMGMSPPPESIAMAEAAIGMRLRDDFLAAFGNEVAFAYWESRPAAVAKIRDDDTMEESQPSANHFVALLEIRNPEAVDAALTKLFASEGGAENAHDSYRDAPLTVFGSFAYAYLDGFGIFGDRADVQSVVDAVRENRTLGTTADYASAVGTVPDNVLMGSYMSPHFFEMAAKEIDKTTGVPRTVEPVRDGLFFAVQKDASGVFGTVRIPIPNLKTLLEKDKRPSVLSRR